ncbi:MAG: hypothetical protein AB7F86_20145 [Bdellovibrionales bacterium]
MLGRLSLVSALFSLVLAFNNCGGSLRALPSDRANSSTSIADSTPTSNNSDPGTDTDFGTDVGNPVGRKEGPEMPGIASRVCSKIEACTGQVILSCPTLLYTAPLQGVSEYLGASAATSLDGVQYFIDQSHLTVDSAGLNACYAELESMSCDDFPNPISDDYAKKNAQIAAVLLQVNSCQNILSEP